MLKKCLIVVLTLFAAALYGQEVEEDVFPLLGHSGSVLSVAFSPDGKRILSGSWDTTTRIWDAGSGGEIAQFIGFSGGEWIVITPGGCYNASPKGDQYLNVRVGSEVYGIEQFRRRFYRPDIVRLALAGDTEA